MEQYEKDHLAVVLNNAAECTVLLKTNGRFPLKSPCRLAAYGAGVRHTVRGGTGSGEVNTRFSYTIEEGLENAGFTITTKTWLDAYDAIRTNAFEAFKKHIKWEAIRNFENPFLYVMGKIMPDPEYELPLEAGGDAAVYVVSRSSGEGSDRETAPGDVQLTKSEIRDILALNRQYETFMLVLNVGGVIDLSPVMEIGNILLLSQFVDCGRVLSDILTGKQNPSGKLTDTLAPSDQYSSEGTFGQWNDNLYKEGIYVGYRYFDTFHKKVLFPFGFGLSFTTFAMGVEGVRLETGTVIAAVRVKNTGSHPGKEVVQAYISKPVGKLDQPYQELAGFQKTSLLLPGAEEMVNITFRLSDFASYDEETACYLLESGDYIVRIGNSSANTEIAAVVSLGGTVVTKKVRKCLGNSGFKDIRGETRKKESIPETAVHLSLDPSVFTTRVFDYDPVYETDKRVRSLSEEDLCYLAIGAFAPTKGSMSIIGNAANHVAGAAGESTSMLVGKGIKPLIMADGPAGLRLALHYYEDETGAHDASNASIIPQSILDFMGPFSRWLALKLTGGERKPPQNAVIHEQCMTMIPIGTAIAQSFNPDLAKAFGGIVGSEMEMTRVHLWLAPALNIHRNILCGRNFEYYSEDPLVSGIMAAAVVQGVQSHPGCGATIKHYAANNAETNRYFNSSQVSERAMREIYLKGFEICVRESQPHAVMTSYNLLNGVHTSEHKGLLEDVLRCEFGFKGIVMTDWVIDSIGTNKKSVYRGARADEVAKAGGDIFMPGSEKDYKIVVNALKDGSLKREQLEINASRLLKMIDKLV